MFMNRRAFVQAAAALAVLPWLTACAKRPPLTLSGHKKLSYEVLFMARDFGWLEQADVELIDTQDATETMQALRDGLVQGAMLGLDEALLLCSQGLDLEVVLLFGISIGTDVLLVRPDIPDAKSIQGQILGYEETVTSKLILHEFLQRHALTEQDLTLVSLKAGQLEHAWHTHQVDALITGGVLANRLQQQGAKAVFGSRQLPDRIFDVLVVTKQAGKRYRTELERLMQAYFRSLHHFRTNPMDSSYRIAKRLEVKAEDVFQLYRGLLLPDALANYAYLSQQDARLVKAAQEMVVFMRDTGVLAGCYQAESSLSNAYIPRELL